MSEKFGSGYVTTGSVYGQAALYLTPGGGYVGFIPQSLVLQAFEEGLAPWCPLPRLSPLNLICIGQP